MRLVENKRFNKPYVEMTDTELVIASQRSDEVALAHLLKRYERVIKGRLYRLAPDWKDNSDLVQEVYIRVWRCIDQIKNPNSFKIWLLQIVTNLFYDELRKRPRLQIVSIDEPVVSEDGAEKRVRDIKDSSAQPEEKLLARELTSVLGEAMSEIPPQFRMATLLRDVHGLSYEEIAELTKAELGTVKSRISRARVKIQEKIVPYLREAA